MPVSVSDTWIEAIESGMTVSAYDAIDEAMEVCDSWSARKAGSYARSQPETAGITIIMPVDGTEVTLYRTTKDSIAQRNDASLGDKVAPPIVLDNEVDSMSKLSIKLNELLDNTETLEDTKLLPEELVLLEKLADKLRLAERQAKQFKRQSAEESPVFHQGKMFDLRSEYGAIGVARVAIAESDTLHSIAEHMRNHFISKYDSFRWQCVVTDKVDDIGCDCDFDPSTGGHCFLSVQGLAFFKTWARNQQTDS
ncbi:hypothetical protein HDE_01583 [Halotydeus destructor]|nr:hypothetical protein HDE_01583 [Halotydeus destructor]